MFELNQEVFCYPSILFSADQADRTKQIGKVKPTRGRICYIDPKGKFCRVVFDAHGHTMRESFPTFELTPTK